MSVEHLAYRAIFDVLDRVLDKGIVVDAWARASRSGIDLLTAEERLVVTFVDTYGQY